MAFVIAYKRSASTDLPNLCPAFTGGVFLSRVRSFGRLGNFPLFPEFKFFQSNRSDFMKRRWSDEEIAKLQAWAGKRRAADIAADLGRGKSATVVKAHLLKVSLRVKDQMDPGPAGMPLTG
jgi:hypothetical protein